MIEVAELLQRQAALEEEIVALQKAGRRQAISNIHALMKKHGLTFADLSTDRSPKPTSRSGKTGKRVAAKYRDPATGETWTGRGLTPKWLNARIAEGRSKAEFEL